MPYKHSIINKFAIFDEVCFIFGWMTLLFFKENKLDINEESSVSTLEYATGWVFVSFIWILWAINFVFLIPMKMFESYLIIKAFLKSLWGNIKKLINRSKAFESQTEEYQTRIEVISKS